MAILLHGFAYCYAVLQEAPFLLTLTTLRATFEYLGGERDDPPSFLAGRFLTAARCAVWVLAIVLIYAFCGQSSKFIYIDF